MLVPIGGWSKCKCVPDEVMTTCPARKGPRGHGGECFKSNASELCDSLMSLFLPKLALAETKLNLVVELRCESERKWLKLAID